MAISFKMTHAHTGPLSAPDPAAGHCQPTPLPETPGPSQACLGQSLVGSLLLSPGSWCTQGFVCALQESASPVLCKFYSQIPSKSNSLGVLNCFARSPGWKICSGSQDFLNSVRISLVYVVQFVGHLLGGSMVGLMAISSKRAYACMTQDFFYLLYTLLLIFQAYGNIQRLTW